MICTCVTAAPLFLEFAAGIGFTALTAVGVIVKRSPIGIVLGGYFLGRFALGLPMKPGVKVTALGAMYTAVERWLCVSLALGAFVAPMLTGLSLIAAVAIWAGAQTVATVRRGRAGTWTTECNSGDGDKDGPLAIEGPKSGIEEEAEAPAIPSAPVSASLFIESLRLDTTTRTREYQNA